MKRFLIFFLIVAPILALLAFGLTRDARILPSMMVNKKAPPFFLTTLDGKTITSESIAGKPAVINFWATWCGPCFQEHPLLKAASSAFKGGEVAFLGVVYQDKEKEVLDFVKEFGEPFKVVFDSENKMAIDYGVGGVPETFFLDSQGVIREKTVGVLTAPLLKKNLEKILPP